MISRSAKRFEGWDALERIRSSGLVGTVVCTDSHPRAEELKSGFLRVESVASLFREHLLA